MPTAVITGTNRGLGLVFVTRYLDQSWQVFALNRSESERLSTLKSSGNLTVLKGDLANPSDLEGLAKTLKDSLGIGSIDLLINNAGIMGASTFRVEDKVKQGLFDFSREEWRAVMEINLLTPAQLIALLRPAFADGARIVTISSSMGSIADNQFGGWYAYRASKAAVNSLMKSVALELGDSVVAVALHPGWVQTDMGGAAADIDAATSVEGMMNVINGLQPEDSGGFFSFSGSRLNY